VGCQVLALVWTAPPATVAPALERIVKHVRRIVFLSAPLKTPHPRFQQPNPLRALAEQIERQIGELRSRVDLPAAWNVRCECPVLVGAATPCRRRYRVLALSRHSDCAHRRA
jgi:hypothetical protein